MKKIIAMGTALFKKHEEVIRYLFFGVLATALNIVIYTLFNLCFGYAFANGIGNVIDNVICILFAYFTNRAFVFQSKTQGAAARKEFLQFVGCRIGTLVADAAIMYGCGTVLGELFVPADYLGIWGIGVKILANIVVVVLNYILSKLIVFKAKE
ncbi:MAG: GtrA family protein [Faecalibacterium sp.]